MLTPLQAIENLESLTLIEDLWLGKNKIRALEVCCLFSLASSHTIIRSAPDCLVFGQLGTNTDSDTCTG